VGAAPLFVGDQVKAGLVTGRGMRLVINQGLDWARLLLKRRAKNNVRRHVDVMQVNGYETLNLDQELVFTQQQSINKRANVWWWADLVCVVVQKRMFMHTTNVLVTTRVLFLSVVDATRKNIRVIQMSAGDYLRRACCPLSVVVVAVLRLGGNVFAAGRSLPTAMPTSRCQLASSARSLPSVNVVVGGKLSTDMVWVGTSTSAVTDSELKVLTALNRGVG
jgi:hypothetical protein